MKFCLLHYCHLYTCALLSFIIFNNCEVLPIFLRLLNIFIILRFWNNDFFPCKGILTVIDASLQIELAKLSRASRGWGTVRVSFIWVKSVICKLDLELAFFRDSEKKQIRWIILCRCIFSDFAERLRKLPQISCILMCSQLTWVPPAVTAYLISKSQTFSSLGAAKLEEEWSPSGHFVLFLLLGCHFSCFFVTSPLLVLWPAAILLNYINVIPP